MAYRFLFQQARLDDSDHWWIRVRSAGRHPVHVVERETRSRCNPSGSRAPGTTSPTPPRPGPGTYAARPLHRPGCARLGPVDPMALDDGFNGWLMGFASLGRVPRRRSRHPVSRPDGSPVWRIRRMASTPRSSSRRPASAQSRPVNGGAAPDYTNQLAKIRINNWDEVNLIDLQEFSGRAPAVLAADHRSPHSVHDRSRVDGGLVHRHGHGGTVSRRRSSRADVGPRGARQVGLPRHLDVANLLVPDPAAYAALADGRPDDDSDKWNFKTFCIGKKNGNSRPRSTLAFCVAGRRRRRPAT